MHTQQDNNNKKTPAASRTSLLAEPSIIHWVIRVVVIGMGLTIVWLLREIFFQFVQEAGTK